MAAFGQPSSFNSFSTQSVFGQNTRSINHNPFAVAATGTTFGTSTMSAGNSTAFAQSVSSIPSSFGPSSNVNNGNPFASGLFGPPTAFPTSTGASMFSGNSTGIFGTNSSFGSSAFAPNASSFTAFGTTSSLSSGAFAQSVSSNQQFWIPSSFGPSSNVNNGNPFASGSFGPPTSFPTSTGASMFSGTSTGIFGANSSFGSSAFAPSASSLTAFGTTSSLSSGAFGHLPVSGALTPGANNTVSSGFQSAGVASSPFGPSFGVTHSAFCSTPVPFASGSSFGVSRTPSFGTSSNFNFATSNNHESFSSRSIFGQPGSANGSNSIFGTTSGPQTTSIIGSTKFGQSAISSPHGGSSAVKYAATREVLGQGSTEAAGKLVSISAMHTYKDKSHEELRFEDNQLSVTTAALPFTPSTGFSTSTTVALPSTAWTSFSTPSASALPSTASVGPAIVNPGSQSHTSTGPVFWANFPPGKPSLFNSSAQQQTSSPTSTSSGIWTNFRSSTPHPSTPSPFPPSTPSLFQTSTPSLFQTSSPSIFQATPSLFHTSTPSLFQTTPSPFQTSTPSLFQTTPSPFQTSTPSLVQTTPSLFQTSTPSLFQTSTPSPFQTSTPSLVQTTPPPFQTSTPSLFQTSTPSPFQTTPSPFQTSTPSPFQTSTPSLFQTTPSPFQTSTPVALSCTKPEQIAIPQQNQTALARHAVPTSISQQSTAEALKSGTHNQMQPSQSTFGIRSTFQTSAGSPISSTPVQYGISCIPVSDKPAPISRTSMLTARNLTLGRSKPLAVKYQPKTDGKKVPFFEEKLPGAGASLIPKENPRSWILNPMDVQALKTKSSNSSLVEDKSTSRFETGNSDDSGIGKDGYYGSSAKWNLDNEVTFDTTSTQYGKFHLIQRNQTDEISTPYKDDTDVEAMMPKMQSLDYYINPPIQELVAKERAEPGFCSHVKEFEVGRQGYGSIMFSGETDVRNLDLESLIKFNNREVIVYMDESKKPQVGHGLNKPAEVTLLNIKCMDKDTGKQYVDGPKVDKFRKMLIKKAEEQGVEFLSYNPVMGEWKFRVQYF